MQCQVFFQILVARWVKVLVVTSKCEGVCGVEGR